MLRRYRSLFLAHVVASLLRRPARVGARGPVRVRPLGRGPAGRLPFLSAGRVVLGLVSANAASGQAVSLAERFERPTSAQMAREARYWTKVSLTPPADTVIEPSGLLPLPGRRLMITTRRGELWLLEDAFDTSHAPRYHRFAAGLHEPLGIAPAPQGGFYVAQRQEVTLLQDRDGDGEADLYRTITSFPLSGSYHEFAFGPVLAPDGHMRVTLNNSYLAPVRSAAPWRGWMVEVSPDGQLTPIAAGLRSPAGLARTSQGLWLVAENQGEWIGSGYVTEVQRGDFLGHPGSLAWSKLPGSPLTLRPADIPDSGRPLFEVAREVKGLKPPTVWFPYSILGISTSGLAEDTSAGKFGPFAGQILVGDQGQSKVMRMSLEQVRGVWQGAAYPFLQGFESGVIRLAMSEDGQLFVGQTARGWGSVGPKKYALERVTWSGQTPFTIQEVTAQPDGFLIRFTAPVDPATAADPAHYTIAGFIYQYHNRYGSPPVNRVICPVRKVILSSDRRTARVAAVCLREGYIHEIQVRGVRSAEGAEPLLHDAAYYTLNRLPEGARIISIEPNEAELCVSPVASAPLADSARHPVTAPAAWQKAGPARTLLIGTEPGLKFSVNEIRAKPGERLLLVFRNQDDMYHNLVICTPGSADQVAAAAAELGSDGLNRHFVPDRAEVLFHTALLLPGATDRIYVTAPQSPGVYDYLCTFPGHSLSMRGVLRVE